MVPGNLPLSGEIIGAHSAGESVKWEHGLTRLPQANTQPHDAVPLRSVEKPAFLRRRACVDRVQRQELTRE